MPVHLALSLGWTLALDRAGVRTARRGALAGLAIAALDLGVAGHAFPRVRALPLGPQLADHAAFGAIAGRCWLLDVLRPEHEPDTTLASRLDAARTE